MWSVSRLDDLGSSFDTHYATSIPAEFYRSVYLVVESCLQSWRLSPWRSAPLSPIPLRPSPADYYLSHISEYLVLESCFLTLGSLQGQGWARSPPSERCNQKLHFTSRPSSQIQVASSSASPRKCCRDIWRPCQSQCSRPERMWPSHWPDQFAEATYG
jgi:hypothetical protein